MTSKLPMDPTRADERIKRLQAELTSKETMFVAQLADAKVAKEHAEARVSAIEQSLAWRVITKYRSLIGRVVTPDSFQGKLYLALIRRAIHKLSSQKEPPSEKAPDPTSLIPLTNLALPSFPQPQASIIIPAHNHLKETHECLVSIMENTHGIPYEVVLVDDASSDGTKDALAGIRNLRLIINEKNLGFIDSCNLGASHSKAPFLVFLNNDTLVRPGWLHHLLEAALSDERVAAVGPKLLYPDGRLQEAGGIVWCDGTAWNYGRNDDPGKAEYNYLREVDYCSGCCLLIQADLFRRIGGFDGRYAPAYYEDTDIAFAVRDLGYRVIYQPKAEVVHSEGVSHGSDVSSGHKRWQEINRPKFFEKWSSALAAQPVPGSELLRARERQNSSRVLIIDATVPTHDQDAGSLRMYSLVEILLDMGFSVTFVPDNRDPRQPYTSHLQSLGVEVIYGSADLAERVRAFSADLRFCIASRPSVAWRYLQLIREYAPETIFIYDTVDLHFLREQRRADYENRPSLKKAANAYRHLELALVQASDQTLTVSRAEKDVLMDKVPDAVVDMLPTIHEVEEQAVPWRERSGLVFVGGFAHPPNVAAANLLINEIFPLVKKQLPEVKLWIVGSNPPDDYHSLDIEDVIVTGFVHDLRTLLRGSRVAVCPLTYGAGLKGKITLSLSLGLPSVTTSIGAEGIEIDGRAAILVADDPHSFALKVVALYRNEQLWTCLSEQGIKHARETYSPDAIKKTLEGILRRSRASEPHSELASSKDSLRPVAFGPLLKTGHRD